MQVISHASLDIPSLQLVQDLHIHPFFIQAGVVLDPVAKPGDHGRGASRGE